VEKSPGIIPNLGSDVDISYHAEFKRALITFEAQLKNGDQAILRGKSTISPETLQTGHPLFLEFGKKIFPATQNSELGGN
jgi:hypothetical protein